MENEKEYPLCKVIFQVVISIFLAFFLLFGVPVLVAVLWTANQDAKYEEMKPQVRELAAAYIAEQYPGNDFEMADPFHNFKDNSFDVKVRSRSSADTCFTIRFNDTTLEVDYDSYEWAVLQRGNTMQRIVDDYDDRVKTLLKGTPGMLYVGSDFVRYSETASTNLDFSPDGLDSSTLKLDGVYDAGEMGWHFGCLSVKFQEKPENVNILRLLERLRELDEAMTRGGVGYQVVGITLEPKSEGQNVEKLTVYAIRRADLYSDDPLAVLQALWEEQEANRQALKEKWEKSE